MNITNFAQANISARLFAAVTIVSLLLSAFPVAFFVAQAAQEKVDICHWTEGEGGKFNQQSPNRTANAGGHADHQDGKDIIPAFDYPAQGNEPAGSFPGQNLTTDYNGFTGAEVLAAGCNTEISGTISGAKYDDVDNDASISGDSTIPGWAIRLYEDGTPWTLVDTTLTDVDGEYEFADLPEGSYKVCEVMQTDWTQTFVSNGSTNESPNASEEGPECRTVNINDLDDSNTVNFGNYYEEEVVKTSETIVVTESSWDAVGNPAGTGWYFNPNPPYTAPFEFNSELPSIGIGSFLGGPLTSTPDSKVIATLQAFTPVADFESFSYDFAIKTNDLTDENHFYLNVYANFGSSAATGFYDCRYDVVPTVGVVNGYTTVTFDANSSAATVTTRATSPQTCPANIADMDTINAGSEVGSVIRAFTLNIGHTSDNDAGVSGYFDNVVLDTATKVTTFDFEPAAVVIPGCTDESAANYDKEATVNDDSCVFLPVSQCVDFPQNLLTNGSFEVPEVTNNSKWQKFGTVPSWTVTRVSDDTPTTLELMENIFGNEAADGDQYAELDGDHSTMVTQSVSGLIEGGTYELSWAFAGRHNAGDVHNQMDILVNGSSVATEGPQSDPKGLASYDWTRNAVTFVADASEADVAFADAGPSNSYGTYLDDAQLCLVAEPVPVVPVTATKIVCDYEEELPKWGKGNNGNPGEITATTAADWMANEGEGTTCRVVEDWQFQWSDRSVSSPGNYNKFLGEAPGWNTFTGTVDVPFSALNGGNIEFREVLPLSDDYVSFGGNDTKASAELYCGNDVVNYDNLERVNKPAIDEAIHCVAWNIPKVRPPQTCSIFSDTQTLVVDTNEYAVETYEHRNWSADINGAEWVWATEQVENPSQEEIYTFEETFTVDNPTSALLDIAADNTYKVFVNGDLVLDRTSYSTNFTTASLKEDVDILSFLNVTGENTITFEVTNLAGRDDYRSNPAGVLYRLDIESKYACEVTTEPVPPATLVITSPATPDQTLVGVHDFTADYNDNDPEVDFIRWAIRAGTCEAGTNTVAGNVDGFSDNATFTGNNFSAIVDMSTWDNGDYCFVVNPDEGDDEDLRATQTFILNNTVDPVLPPVTSCAYVSNLALNTDPSQENVAENLTSFSLNDLAYTTGDEFDLFVGGDIAANGSFSDEAVVERTVDGLRVFFYGTGVNGGPVTEFSGSFTLNGVDLTNAVIAADSEPNETGGAWPDTFTVDQTTGVVDFTLYTNSGNDSFVITGLENNCDVVPPVPTETISGFVYNDTDGDGSDLDGDAGIAGRTVYATANEPENEGDALEVFTTTTDEFGFYSFTLPVGEWNISEEDPSDWTQTAVYQNGEKIDFAQCYFNTNGYQYEDFTASASEQDFESTEVGYSCDFYSQEDEEEVDQDPAPTRTSGGTRTSRSSLPTAVPAGLVAGVQTSECPFMVDYLQMGVDNDPMEVMKLQLFLNIFKDMYGGTANPVTGNFGIITDTNVKTFQSHFKDEVLNPWFNQGIVGHTKPTGFVYKTTLWKINDIVCGADFPSLEGENLQTNVDLNARAIQD